MLSAIVAHMRKVLDHPGYGTHLKKPIEYLALICEYQLKFDWLSTKDIHTLKDELYQRVVESLKRRVIEQYEKDFNWSLMGDCLAVAKTYQFEDIINIRLPALSKQIQKNLDNPQIFDLVKGCLKIAEEFHHQELRNLCENILLTKIQLADSYNKILVLVNQFNLTRVKEACENLKQ